MRRHQRNQQKGHPEYKWRHRERRKLNQSFVDFGRSWTVLGKSMGSNALRGVVQGMRATAEALESQPFGDDSLTSKPEHFKPLRHWTNVAATWANVGLEIGRVALEKSAEGLENTANTLERERVFTDVENDRTTEPSEKS